MWRFLLAAKRTGSRHVAARQRLSGCGICHLTVDVSQLIRIAGFLVFCLLSTHAICGCMLHGRGFYGSVRLCFTIYFMIYNNFQLAYIILNHIEAVGLHFNRIEKSRFCTNYKIYCRKKKHAKRFTKFDRFMVKLAYLKCS